MAQVVLPRPRAVAQPVAPAAAQATTRVRLAPVLLAVAPGLALAWWSGLATTWDGASFLFRIVHFGRPEILHGRFGSALWQLPAVLAADAGASIGMTRALFGLGFVLVPLIALWLSWLVARDADPRLFTCAAFGILASAAPVQAFLVGEMLIVLQLGWVVLLAAATGGTTTWGRRLAVPVAILILVTHPVSALVLGAAAVLLVTRWWSDGRRPMTRGALATIGALVLVALLRMLLVNGYERANTGDQALSIAWDAFGGWGILLAVSVALLAVALLLFVAAPARRSPRSRSVVPFGLLGVGGALLAVWAATPTAWANAVNFRVFDSALMLAPVLGAAVVVLTPRAGADRAAPSRSSAFVVGCGVVLSVVLGLQAFAWHDATGHLRAQVRDTPGTCVTFAELPALRDAPLASHWASAMLVLELQGRHPHVVALHDRKLCRRYERTGDAELWPWGEVVEDRGAGGRTTLP